MAKESDKERADRMYGKGERDGKSGADANRPHQPLLEVIFGVSDRDKEDNDNYMRGYRSGEKNSR